LQVFPFKSSQCPPPKIPYLCPSGKAPAAVTT
jgi:hypothetical protein